MKPRTVLAVAVVAASASFGSGVAQAHDGATCAFNPYLSYTPGTIVTGGDEQITYGADATCTSTHYMLLSAYLFVDGQPRHDWYESGWATVQTVRQSPYWVGVCNLADNPLTVHTIRVKAVFYAGNPDGTSTGHPEYSVEKNTYRDVTCMPRI